MTLTFTQIPLRLRVLQGLTNTLKTVTPSNGYNYDLSDYTDTDGVTVRSRVFRGRNIFGDNDPLPMVSILENPHTEPTMHDSPKWQPFIIGPWELLIQGWVKDDLQNPTDPAHFLMADVKRCLAIERGGVYSQPGNYNIFGLGANAVHDIFIGAGVVRPPDSVSAYACFWLMITLQLSEDMSNPFA